MKLQPERIILTALFVLLLAVGGGTAPLIGLAADKKSEKLKPYTLKTCVVSGDKLGEMGAPFVYAYEGREIKFCCKGCLKDFKKDPANYIKKVEEEEAKAKKAKSS
jgi:YHS domain-containing protein